MTKEKKAFVTVLTVLAMVAIFSLGTLLVSGKFSTPPLAPAMPTGKSAVKAPTSIILEKTLQIKEKALQAKKEAEQKDELIKKIRAGESALIEKLENRGVKIRAFYDLSVYVSVPFLQNLLTDKESQKIFKQFSDAKITIYLNDYYCISPYGNIWIDARDGVKKVAEWLETGKH